MSRLVVPFLIASWVAFFVMIYCYGQYDNTLNCRWRYAGAAIGIGGSLATVLFFRSL